MKYLVYYLLFLLLVSSIILYFLIKKEKLTMNKKKEIILIPNEITLTNDFNINKTVYELVKRDKLILPNQKNTLILSWEMFIPNISGEFYWRSFYGKDKSIFKLGDSPHVYYNPKLNTLRIMARYIYSPFFNHYPILEFKNIHLQKWNSFVIVFQTYNIKVYYNKELVLNTIYESPILIDDTRYKEVKVGEVNNNIYGKLDNMKLITANYSNKQILNL